MLKDIALDEANLGARWDHTIKFGKASTKENLEKMLSGEKGTNKAKREAAVKAKEAGVDEPHDHFDESSRDEARHARALQDLLNRYFGQWLHWLS